MCIDDKLMVIALSRRIDKKLTLECPVTMGLENYAFDNGYSKLFCIMDCRENMHTTYSILLLQNIWMTAEMVCRLKEMIY